MRVNLQRRTITEFDHAALPIDKKTRKIIHPSEADKKLLGTILGEAINKAFSGEKTIDDILVQNIAEPLLPPDFEYRLHSYRR